MKYTLIFILTVFLCSFSEQAKACSCKGESSIVEEFKSSDAVIVGTILKKELVSLTDSSRLKLFSNDTLLKHSRIGQFTVARYDLLVERVYKGEITKDTISVYSGLGGGDCGKLFEIGKRYILYGMKETYFGQVNNHYPFPKGKNTLWTNNCMRTAAYDQQEITEIERFTGKK